MSRISAFKGSVFYLSAAASILTLSFLRPAAGQTNSTDGQYQQYGQDSSNGHPISGGNPMLGRWMLKHRTKDGAMMYTYAEYSTNGSVRATSIVRGGLTDGMRLQIWGHYTLKQLAPNRYSVTAKWEGSTPRQSCIQGGSCETLPQPVGGTEIDDFRDADHFHAHSENKDHSNDADLERSAIPRELLTPVAATYTMAASAPHQGTQVTGNGGQPHYTPKNNIPGLGNNCDDAQQRRVCSVNNHALYKDNRGCLVCTP